MQLRTVILVSALAATTNCFFCCGLVRISNYYASLNTILGKKKEHSQILITTANVSAGVKSMLTQPMALWQPTAALCTTKWNASLGHLRVWLHDKTLSLLFLWALFTFNEESLRRKKIAMELPNKDLESIRISELTMNER